MSCEKDDSDATTRAGATPLLLARAGSLSFERSSSNASRASMAALNQSFFDSQPRCTSRTYDKTESAVPELAVTDNTLQRAIHLLPLSGRHPPLPRPLSRPGKEFFEDEGEVDDEQRCLRFSHSKECLCEVSAAASFGAGSLLSDLKQPHDEVQDSVPVSPAAGPLSTDAITPGIDAVGNDSGHARASPPWVCSPLPRSPGTPSGTTNEEGTMQRNAVRKVRRHSRSSPFHDTISFATMEISSCALPFFERYAASTNAYLRAAAMELAEAKPPGAQFIDRKASERICKPTDSPPHHPHNVFHLSGTAAHVPPNLTRPASTAARRRPTLGYSPVRSSLLPAASASSVPSAAAVASTPPVRGFPLFVKTHRPADWAPVSSSSTALSLRTSLEEYGRLQLQDEAVRWYHRSSVLGHQLNDMQRAYKCQSRLLAAHWRGAEGSNVGAESSAKGMRDRPVEEVRDAVSALPSTSRWTSALTSHSPDTLLRAHACDETEDGYSTELTLEQREELSSEDSQYCLSEGRKRMRMENEVPRGPSLGKLEKSGMLCRVPQTFSARTKKEDFPEDCLKHSLSSQVRRGPPELDTSAAESPPPLSRVSVGPQTDGVAADKESSPHGFRDPSLADAPSAVTNTAVEDRVCLTSSSMPSAIMSKQYAAAVEEMEVLRGRVDLAERASTALQEMCAAQALRCDELETQLLGKEEQLLRFEQQDARATALTSDDGGQGMADAAAPTYRSVDVCPLIAQVRELLILVRSGRDGASCEQDTLSAREEGVMVSHTAPFDAAEDNHLLQFDDFTALPLTASSAASYPAPASTDSGCAVDLLASLLTQLHSAVTGWAQQFAALEAELEVVRADRNELIGGQSEQVRLLQVQLLEKDQAQLRLMGDLHQAQRQLDIVKASSPLVSLDTNTKSGVPSALQHQLHQEKQDEEAAASTDSCTRAQGTSLHSLKTLGDAARRSSPQRVNTSVSVSPTEDASAARVVALQQQLAQVRAAAAAGQEAQRRVLTERLEQAEMQLKDTRLRAEAECSHMSGTIERLTRELADAKKALQIKEMSLRIALRESFSPPLLLSTQGENAMCHGALTGSPDAERLGQRGRSSGVQSTVQLARAVSHGSGASPSPPQVRSEGASTSVSPSPPVPPRFQSTARRSEVGRGVAGKESDGDGIEPFSFMTRRAHPRLEDDGAWQTLPSTVLVEGEDTGEGLGCTSRLVPPSVGALTMAIKTTGTTTSASREHSSQGLTVSMCEVSRGGTSMPRERSDASSVMAGQHRSERENTSREGLPLLPPPPPSNAHVPPATGEEDAMSIPKEEQCFISPPLPLPPLRGPLFSSSASSESPSPEQHQRSLPLHYQETNHGARLGIRASISQGRDEQRVLWPTSDCTAHGDSSARPAQYLSPEAKLRLFLTDFLPSPSPLEGTAKEKICSSPSKRAPNTQQLTSHIKTHVEAVAKDIISREVEGPASSNIASSRVPIVCRDGTTPSRTPLTLDTAGTSSAKASTPSASRLSSSLLSSSPFSAEVAARYAQALLSRHRETWQQQELLLHSLQRSPSQ